MGKELFEESTQPLSKHENKSIAMTTGELHPPKTKPVSEPAGIVLVCGRHKWPCLKFSSAHKQTNHWNLKFIECTESLLNKYFSAAKHLSSDETDKMTNLKKQSLVVAELKQSIYVTSVLINRHMHF